MLVSFPVSKECAKYIMNNFDIKIFDNSYVSANDCFTAKLIAEQWYKAHGQEFNLSHIDKELQQTAQQGSRNVSGMPRRIRRLG